MKLTDYLPEHKDLVVVIRIPAARVAGSLHGFRDVVVPCELDGMESTAHGGMWWVKLKTAGAGFKKGHRLKVGRNQIKVQGGDAI